MNIPNNAWIVVLDGEKFLLLRNQGDPDLPDLRIIAHDEIENPPTVEQGVERPGRFPDAGHGYSAVQQTDWHLLEKTDFAADISDRLKKWAMQNRYKDLVIIAEAQTLGRLRKQLHQEVSIRLIAEIDKDLTNLPTDKLEPAILKLCEVND
ncbi:host attachment family protein [Qingshengfaniella alkalisoli]|uniref:Host attachment protein n=1 Tax=Qingshengfaniella alkalisoli TaxID=2599296 RepID=A0A5B8I9V4_9RHOB|nr:host attachment family protein [Qingshengfaniella alkalisoli]QDY71125.1 host attachment protein [Qingshengfaniella alkalisoli]